MYSHIIGMDEELWDILEEGVGNLRLDEEGVALDRKAHTTEQKKLYKKHHLIRGILVAALPHKEYVKMSDKSDGIQNNSNFEGLFDKLDFDAFSSKILTRKSLSWRHEISSECFSFKSLLSLFA